MNLPQREALRLLPHRVDWTILMAKLMATAEGANNFVEDEKGEIKCRAPARYRGNPETSVTVGQTSDRHASPAHGKTVC